ncbi:MAG: plasmid stabilization protein [Verrucomicrobia bacterium]|nr:MAG: plasmid stabilization protein [Verrucomicrobiota bacterium]PYL88451.1 MAG: plasmid stabilization protein [Verrucomicrobiota bacterium]
MFEILLERGAERDLRRLPKSIHDRIVRAINALSRNPRPPGCRKLSGSENDWRIRVGDYRIIYEVADADQVIRINRVRHRREIYR